MKAILMSIKPQHVANILNGLKTIEVRKKFPKDFVGWVYIYVTHGRQLFDLRNEDTKDNYRLTISKSNNVRWSYPPLINGKVVARFWCDKVKEFSVDLSSVYDIWQDIKETCLTEEEIIDYILGKNYFQGTGYAIHITKLEIFNKPKDISEFYKVGYENSVIVTKKYILGSMNREERRRYKTELDLKINNEIAVIKDNYKLTRAPQSWCYIEVDL